MPSPKSRRYLAIALTTLGLIAIGGWVFLHQSNEPAITLDDGSTLTVVDFTTSPNEKLFIGAPWKKALMPLVKDTELQKHLNAGFMDATNNSTISWYRTGPANSPLVNMLLNNQIVAIDSQGKEHPAQHLFSGQMKGFTGGTGEFMVCVIQVPLGPEPTLRFYLMNRTNELRLKK
ncbi:MAG TPA: hypothetical protein VGH19_22495 [Verrucomicrobiae bacterium]